MTLLDLTTPTTRPPKLDRLPVAVIGAGPIGLAAAAHLVERGIDFVVYEAGTTPAAAIAAWGHIRLFSPWRELIDPAARRLLEAAGWQAPNPQMVPTGAELIDEYLAPLAGLPEIAARVQTGTAVLAVTREGMDRTRTAGRAATPFSLRLRRGTGNVEDISARAVIDASGTYRNPNSLGSSGIDPLGIDEVRDRVSHALPDVLGTERNRFAGRHTAIVGAGHSAANTLLNLATLAEAEDETRITWVIRNVSAVRIISSADDELPARASLGARVDALVRAGKIKVVDRFEIIRLEADGEGVAVYGNRIGGVERIDVDIVVNATGFRPNLDMLREIRLELDDIVEAPKRLAPLIDPNVHTCGTVEPHGFAELQQPEQNFFIAGMKSYGRAPTFLLAAGYEQVRSITAWLAGDVESARKVELVLPATGVCSSGIEDASSCCS
jgi:thioredoxin reductase